MNKYIKRRLGRDKKIAKERIMILLELASKNKEKSNRYCHLARTISKKFKVRFSKEQNLICCKKCESFLRIGETGIVRLAGSKLVRHCNTCGDIWRISYLNEQKIKRKTVPSK